jgi:hypothetical protein
MVDRNPADADWVVLDFFVVIVWKHAGFTSHE